jgi:diguanylate cyclase (GGDEF)-like protein/PAS domain S-box-containing protein
MTRKQATPHRDPAATDKAGSGQVDPELDTLRGEVADLQEELEQAMSQNNAMALEVELLKLELNQIFNGSADGMWVVDTEFRVQRINRAMAAMIGSSAEDILGRKCFEVLQCRDSGSENCPMVQLRRGTSRFEQDWRLHLSAGQFTPVIRTATPFLGIDGALVAILVSHKDITARHQAGQELERANQELRRLATIDGLTQVANRRRFDQQLKVEWRRMRRQGTPLSLVICDIDYFKRYNDSCGHQQGDTCLISVAQSLDQSVRRPADLVTRYGGEEFAAILPDTPSGGARIVAEIMRQQVQDLKMDHPDSPIDPYVTISVGVASGLPSAGTRPEQLLAQADKALYQAKTEGRNRVIGIEALPADTRRRPDVPPNR